MSSSLLFLTVAGCFSSVATQCSWITLSGSHFNSDNGLNGDYELMYGVWCNLMNIWIQRHGSPVVNYVFYSERYGWVVAPVGCNSGPFQAKAHGYYLFPYNVPVGSWYELSGDDVYYMSSNMNVYCNSTDLSGWAIFAIVMSCAGCAALVALVIGLLCTHHKKKKKKNRHKAPENTTVGLATEVEVSTHHDKTVTHFWPHSAESQMVITSPYYTTYPPSYATHAV